MANQGTKFRSRAAYHDRSAHAGRDWRKSMSDNVAYALLVYTGITIFVTVGAMKAFHLSLLPYFALAVLVAAIIPACRAFEKRWASLSDNEASDPAFAGAYRRDQFGLWLLAIGLPLALAALIKLLASIV
ncbi:hypothetical protein [Qipengyuania sp. JC766]|uniref:hypothetical protein n=1 Tax=Qipengyuania sp. JC766 TaxID=3232139 RepID=UPI003459E3CA